MAYGTSVSPMGYKPVKKMRPKNTFQTKGNVTGVDDGTVAGKNARGSYTATNTSGNARAGMKYRTRVTSKGVVHDYAGTKNDVLVKKPKTANPSRSLLANTPPSDSRSRANPEGHAGYRIPYADDTNRSPYKPGSRGKNRKRPARGTWA